MGVFADVLINLLAPKLMEVANQYAHISKPKTSGGSKAVRSTPRVASQVPEVFTSSGGNLGYNPVYKNVATTRGFFKDPFSPTGWSYSNAHGDIQYSPNATQHLTSSARAGGVGTGEFVPYLGGMGDVNKFIPNVNMSLVKFDASGKPIQPMFARTQGIEISKPAIGTPEYDAYKIANDEWFNNRQREMNQGTSFGENMYKLYDWFTRPAENQNKQNKPYKPEVTFDY